MTQGPLKTIVRRLQGGFTLMELMVVVVIIGILASVGGPMYSNYMLRGNLNQAIPVMMAIAAKERSHFNRTGYYLATTYEQQLQQKLGLNLHDYGDFCFMVFCVHGAGWSCGTYGEHDGKSVYNSSITANADLGTLADTPDKATVTQQFQVIAVLRQRVASTPTAPATVDGAGQTCHASDTGFDSKSPAKTQPQGWVADAGTKGGEGRVIVMSYPPPVDGAVTSSIRTGADVLQWVQGVTLTDALSTN